MEAVLAPAGAQELGTLAEFSAHLPLRVAVLTRLRAAIMDGTLKPGTTLSENKIATQFSVSRTPVREALRALEHENLVTVLPGRKVVVTVPDPQDINEIYDIRLIVESEALRRIARDPGRFVAQLDGCVQRAREAAMAGDLAKLKETNTQFHMTIVSALNNRRMQRFVDSVYDSIMRFRQYSLEDEQWMIRGVEEHADMLELLKAGDARAAVRMLDDHLSHAKEALSKVFASYSRMNG